MVKKNMHSPFFSSRRQFSRSCQWGDHYDTLNIPHNASKGQIKSSYYQLSKRYHPDVNRDPQENSKFPALRAAYDTLIDDRKRRAYDRSFSPASTSASGHAGASTSSMHPEAAHWSYSTHRHRGATHAWQRHRRASHGPYTYSRPFPDAHPDTEHHWQGQNHAGPPPFSSRASQSRSAFQQRWDAEQEALDRIKGISNFWRNTVIVGSGILVYSLWSGARA